MFNDFFFFLEKRFICEEMWKKRYGRARETTDGNIIQRISFACWITKAKHTCNTYYFSKATMVPGTRLSVTSYVHYLSCLKIMLRP
jgi:hypothetical protein